MTEAMTLDHAGVEEVLQNAPIAKVKGVDGHSLVYTVTLADGTVAIFKDRSGVSGRQERAAWIVDRSLGWNLVAPVVLRSAEINGKDRLWVVSLFVEGAVEAPSNARLDSETSIRAAAFDYLLLVWDRQIWNWLAVPPTLPEEFWRLVLIDHHGSFGEGGLVGSRFYASRRGSSLPPHVIDDLKRFAREMPVELMELLSTEARVALRTRAIELASTERMPTYSDRPRDAANRHLPHEREAVARQREFANAVQAGGCFSLAGERQCLRVIPVIAGSRQINTGCPGESCAIRVSVLSVERDL